VATFSLDDSKATDGNEVLSILKTIATSLLCTNTLSCNVGAATIATRRRLQATGTSTTVEVRISRKRSATSAASAPPIIANAVNVALAQSAALNGAATFVGTSIEALSAEVNVLISQSASVATGSIDRRAVTNSFQDLRALTDGLATTLPHAVGAVRAVPIDLPNEGSGRDASAPPTPPRATAHAKDANGDQTATAGQQADVKDSSFNGIAIAVPTVAALLIVAVAIASYRRAKGKSCCARARSDSNMVYPQVDGAASVQEVVADLADGDSEGEPRRGRISIRKAAPESREPSLTKYHIDDKGTMWAEPEADYGK